MKPHRSSSREIIALRVVQQVLTSLPTDLKNATKQCSIELHDTSSNGDLLGLFEGCARNDPPPEAPADLPRITLFLHNLWEYADRDAKTYRAEVRITLLHELAHYLGLDEEAVEALGLG
jgi:predicted Zn-dependent protease with MMP-like domain